MTRLLATQIALVIALFATPSWATDGRLGGPGMEGFTLKDEKADSGVTVVEWIPKGQNAENYSIMVTFATLPGIATVVKPDALYEAIKADLEKDCPDGKFSGKENISIDGRDSFIISANCPKDRALGKPESIYILTVFGPSDVFIKQVNFKYVPTAKDTTWVEPFLKATRFCQVSSSAPTC